MAFLASASWAVSQNNFDQPTWKQVESPTYSDLTCIKFFGRDLGLAGCDKILVCEKDQWSLLDPQPPVDIDKVFAFDSNAYYISSADANQESQLYYLNDGVWKMVPMPLVNVIGSMYFMDKNNGVVAGYGEIIRYINGKWKWLPPPVNGMITSVAIDKNGIVWAGALGKGVFCYTDSWHKIEKTDNVKVLRFIRGKIYLLGNDFFGKITDDKKVRVLFSNKLLENANDFFLLDDDHVFFAAREGKVYYYKINTLKIFDTPVKDDLNALWMLNQNEGWAVGKKGVILHYSNQPKEEGLEGKWKGFLKTTFNYNIKIVDDEYGVVAADFNNDGFQDIFTCGLFEANHLYMNKNGEDFVDNAQQWQVTGFNKNEVHELNLGACAGDFNNDGYIDLYVTVLNGKNKLYKNFKAKYFVNYSDVAGGVGNDNDRTNCVISGDVDNDGDLDLFITNEFSTNRLYLNNGAGIFTEHTLRAKLQSNYGGMGCSFGDVDNDGDLDLYVANWSAKNLFYKNMFVETGELVFENMTDSVGVGGEIYAKSNGVVFADVNNDGFLDLFVTNRKTTNRLYINDGNGFFEDKTETIIGYDTLKSYSAIIQDFDGDGFKDIYLSNVGDNVLYMNKQGRRFVDETEKYVEPVGGYSTGAAAADFDNDGNVEIYMANYIGESSAYLQNYGHVKNKLFIDYKAYKNNKDGIGTKIYIYKSGHDFNKESLLSFFEVSGGGGYASMNQFFIPVSLPEKTVDVRFVLPLGDTLDFKNVKGGQRLLVQDAFGLQKILLKIENTLVLLFSEPVNILKFFKILITLVFMVYFMYRGYKRYQWKLSNILLSSALLWFLFYLQSVNFENKNMFLYFTMPVVSIIVILLITTLFYERIRVERKSREEHDEIREKLSRDLHDDLASTISTIAIYLTLIKYNTRSRDKKLLELLDKTLNLASEASSVITDLIWAIKPKAESFNNLILRINNNFSTLFAEKEIIFRAEFDKDADKLIFDAKVKRNIYLILKEALNNILKYADAKNVNIEIKNIKRKRYIVITDDGHGFDFEKEMSKGHGLSNMQARADEIGAELIIESEKGKGTKISIIFNIQN